MQLPTFLLIWDMIHLGGFNYSHMQTEAIARKNKTDDNHSNR